MNKTAIALLLLCVAGCSRSDADTVLEPGKSSRSATC